MGNKNEKQQQKQHDYLAVQQIKGSKLNIQTIITLERGIFTLFISLESQSSFQKNKKESINKSNPSQQTSEFCSIADMNQRIASLDNDFHKVIVQSANTIEKESLQNIFLSLRDNNKNITDLIICFESSSFCYEDFLEITNSIRKFNNILHLTLKMVNKYTDSNPLFFTTYIQTVLQFHNLQSLEILFSFRKFSIYKQEFQDSLKVLQNLNSLSKISFTIDNACHTEICFEFFIMLAILPNLEDLSITTYVFLNKDEKDEIPNSNIFETINESYLKKLNQSVLKRVILKQLNALDSSKIFQLLQRLPIIRTIELEFDSKNSNQLDSSSKQFLPLYVDPQPPQKKPILDSLKIQLLNTLKLIHFKDILSGLRSFKTYNLSFQFMQSSVYLLQWIGVTDFELEKTLLAVVENKLDFYTDLNQTKNFTCFKSYMKHKDMMILQLIVFEKFIASRMICNPQYVKFDFYFD